MCAAYAAQFGLARVHSLEDLERIDHLFGGSLLGKGYHILRRLGD